MSNAEERELAEDTPVLTRPERLRLHTLGYKDEHIDRMGVVRCKAVIANNEPRPGSKAAIKKNNKKMRAAGLPPMSEAHSDEAVKKRNASPTKATAGVAVTLDEFTNNCLKGDDPLDAILIAHEEKFPGKRFRLINPDLPRVAGPQFQQVYDENGKALGEGGLVLGFMPDDIYNEKFVVPNLERAAKMSGQINNPKAINEGEAGGDLSMSAKNARLAPLEGSGLRIERSSLSSA